MLAQKFSLFLDNVIAKPETFLKEDQNAYVEALNIAKDLHNLGIKEKRKEPLHWQEIIDNDPVEKLVIDKLNNEQIWDEIDKQNNPFLKYVNDELDALDDFFEQQSVPDEQENDEDDSVLNDFEYDSLESKRMENRVHSESSDNNDMDFEDELSEDVQDDDEDEKDSVKEVSNKDTDGLNVGFFNLEEFNKNTEDGVNLSEEDDEIDYFADPDGLDNELNANDIMYKDFFDPPPKKKRKQNSSNNLRSKLDIDNNENDYEHDNESLNNLVYDLFANTNDDEEDEILKSSFDKKQERIQKQIEQLEMENAADKDWTLMGEVSGKHRPLNSLLEEDLKFDHIVKPVPIITEEVTMKLEDMIKQRILDETFDDVERKQDPNFRPFLPSKLVELSNEQSKKSLAEIYEENYVKQTSDIPDEKDESLKKEHQEVDNMFKELCHKLDALSNFHYTPKPPRPEITVIADVPAIAMEEVIPVHVSDGTLLAPEEVYDKKKQEVKGDTEMDSNEKKRTRAAKKRLKKKEKKLKERERKVVEKMNLGLGNKHAKQKMMDSLIGQKMGRRLLLRNKRSEKSTFSLQI
ncbi:2656_t:CDS:10 [Dentiscutata erythropus]|uniref:U3 small nucleolar ribonucleoprotein protein MPP10 n=1 Tax=Dentiscutata erythropus TaxID=1348616 RepID=A0A9N9EYU1_9GLOM|nr:2656_t:CDS:10 [Dentiscutata erythropus]